MRAEHAYDATIVGGSFAGLSAAIYLARARRHVLVVDAGEPRNRFARTSHGFFSRDGHSPGEMLAAARTQLLAYPSARLVTGRVARVVRSAEHFLSALEDGAEARSQKVVIAIGIVDLLPDLPGLPERWGTTVLHCPYCHGFEFAGQRLGVLGIGPMSLHQALLLADWGPVTFFTNGAVSPDEGDMRALAARSVAVESEPVTQLEGSATTLSGVRLESGRFVPLDALFVGPRTRLASPIAEQLGCAIDDGPLGTVIRTDADKLTTVPGVYAAGDAARARHTVSWAVADGVTAGMAAHQALVFQPDRHSASGTTHSPVRGGPTAPSAPPA
ncbi:MAG: NAD(P)/FAD-dependent oxidoreductase [Vicinamibacteraceae bacterium]